MCPEEALEGDDSLRGIGRRPPLPSSGGIYSICFALDAAVEVKGRSGRRVAAAGPGLVLYVGSAGGPGGIGARLARHLSRPGRVVWHIDSVSSSPNSRPLFVYYEVGRYGTQAEDELALYLMSRAYLRPLGMAGASDSAAPHMFECYDINSVLEALRARAGSLVMLA
ncbi:MAG: DUF123 domain-containing protein [Acidilobus sp.]